MLYRCLSSKLVFLFHIKQYRMKQQSFLDLRLLFLDIFKRIHFRVDEFKNLFMELKWYEKEEQTLFYNRISLPFASATDH